MSEVVVAGMSPEEAWAAVDQTFPLDGSAWRDVMSRPAPERDGMVRDMVALGGLSWTKKPGAIDALVAALNVAVSIANPLGAVAGGATSVATLLSALKGL